MNKTINEEILKLLEEITKEKNGKALGVDNSSAVQNILDLTKIFLNIHLEEYKARTDTIEKLGKKEGLSREEMLPSLLKDREKFIENTFLNLSFFEAICSLYLPSK